MPKASLARTQTTALLLRTLHYERRQRCNVFCTLILPPFLLLFLSLLARIVRPREIITEPFEKRPKGAFVPRPFNPVQCRRLDLTLGTEEAIRRCRDTISTPNNTVPVFAPPFLTDIVGARDAENPTLDSGLLQSLTLQPFIYPPALEDDSSSSRLTFFDTQTPYDGVFLHQVHNGDPNNLLYRGAVANELENLTDSVYRTKSLSFQNEQDFKDQFFTAWFEGNTFPLYFTAFSFRSFSRSPQGDVDVTATAFYNQSDSRNCLSSCSIVSNVIKANDIIYQALNPGRRAVAYLRRMPLTNTVTNLRVINLVISIVIGFVTHFFFPNYLRFLVYERENRIRSMMSMMGLRRYRYWYGTYVAFYIQYSISIVLQVILGLISGISFYRINTPVSYLILFFIWGHTLIAFAIFLAPFFTNPETAQIIGWLYIFVVHIVGGPFLGRILGDGNTGEGTWFAIMLLPSFAYLRSVYYAGAINSSNRGVVLGSEIYNDFELGMCRADGPFCRSYAFLAVQACLLFLAGLYFDRVLPTAVGNRLHPLFFLGFKRRSTHDAGSEQESQDAPDVLEEARRAQAITDNIENDPFDGVVLDKLSKTYQAKKPVKALQSLSLVAKKGEVLCLLGPNGSGKTTTFRTLVGELEASSGCAYVSGKSIQTQMDEVHRTTGVAPQQNILWHVLTVEEHLFFYGRVKNLAGSALKEAVQNSLNSVQLAFARKRQVRYLSGGMKRRLSVSIALIGDPEFIILDEPSTGLDLLAREHLWRSIQQSKEGKSVLLTTHSLEEAETLSDRVAIVSHGRLRCIGKVEDLQLRLGKGHHLSVSLPSSNVGPFQTALQKIAPEAEVETQLGGNLEYVLPKSFAITRVFELMERERVELEIRDWAINQSTLEDVFLEVTKRTQREMDKGEEIAEP
eukprot:GFKZ01008528.1.p1 GENE.GFKZ01008528.1~~GFKZ01008528.1.p1  ORF type:complete len:907 (+),score=108.45 GFKZ01008528.1:107-2827(+)